MAAGSLTLLPGVTFAHRNSWASGGGVAIRAPCGLSYIGRGIALVGASGKFPRGRDGLVAVPRRPKSGRRGEVMTTLRDGFVFIEDGDSGALT